MNKKIEKLFEDYKDGKSVRDICNEINITEANFRNLLSKNNITRGFAKKTLKVWTAKELEYLINNYKTLHISDICKHLNRPEISIRTKANKLNLYKETYTRKANPFLQSIRLEDYIENNKHLSDKYLEIYKSHKYYSTLRKVLSISIHKLIKLREVYKLPPVSTTDKLIHKPYKHGKNKHGKNKHGKKWTITHGKNKHGKKWTTTQINKLKTLYTDHTAKECAVMLGRSFESIKSKLKELKIKK